MASLTCPKCGGMMRPIQRNGVSVERCVECAGIFLDRGELEHIIEAEQRFFGTSDRGDDRDDDRRSSRGYRDDDDDYYDDDDYRGGRKKKRRKRSIFEDLFDIG